MGKKTHLNFRKMSQMESQFSEINCCRVCGCSELLDILSLGNQWVINFPDGDTPDDGVQAPLEMVVCGNADCSLVQLRHTVDPDLMYKQYWYQSGINQTMRTALKNVTDSVLKVVPLDEKDIVVDIGANDGTLLRSYTVEGICKVGFEPATNLIEQARKETSLILNDYFNAPAFQSAFPGQQASAVTSIAMFYDLDDPNQFVADISQILAPDGVWINQMNYLGTMLEFNAFDNISHEHLEYYSLSSLEYLLARHGLEVFDVEQNDLNGGSIRAFIGHRDKRGVSERVKRLRDKEAPLKDFETYQSFVGRLQNIKSKICDFISNEVSQGKSIHVYGASTRGNTLLQYFGLNKTVITAAAERNPLKWGKKMIGTNIPIVSEDESRSSHPDYFLILPWAFVEEFVKREEHFLRDGGKFILPLPEFKIISQEYL